MPGQDNLALRRSGPDNGVQLGQVAVDGGRRVFLGSAMPARS
jgi:hypothetical protein